MGDFDPGRIAKQTFNRVADFISESQKIANKERVSAEGENEAAEVVEDEFISQEPEPTTKAKKAVFNSEKYELDKLVIGRLVKPEHKELKKQLIALFKELNGASNKNEVEVANKKLLRTYKTNKKDLDKKVEKYIVRRIAATFDAVESLNKEGGTQPSSDTDKPESFKDIQDKSIKEKQDTKQEEARIKIQEALAIEITEKHKHITEEEFKDIQAEAIRAKQNTKQEKVSVKTKESFAAKSTQKHERKPLTSIDEIILDNFVSPDRPELKKDIVAAIEKIKSAKSQKEARKALGEFTDLLKKNEEDLDIDYLGIYVLGETIEKFNEESQINKELKEKLQAATQSLEDNFKAITKERNELIQDILGDPWAHLRELLAIYDGYENNTAYSVSGDDGGHSIKYLKENLKRSDRSLETYRNTVNTYKDRASSAIGKIKEREKKMQGQQEIIVRLAVHYEKLKQDLTFDLETGQPRPGYKDKARARLKEMMPKLSEAKIEEHLKFDIGKMLSHLSKQNSRIKELVSRSSEENARLAKLKKNTATAQTKTDKQVKQNPKTNKTKKPTAEQRVLQDSAKITKHFKKLKEGLEKGKLDASHKARTADTMAAKASEKEINKKLADDIQMMKAQARTEERRFEEFINSSGIAQKKKEIQKKKSKQTNPEVVKMAQRSKNLDDAWMNGSSAVKKKNSHQEE